MSARWGRGVVLLGLLGCVPEVGSPPSLLTGPRAVAVQADPPDVAPGTRVRLRLWVATPSGPAPAADLADARWDFCSAPTPPTEDNFVSPRCLTDPAARIPIAATGMEIEAEVPAEACAGYGPQAPPQSAGDPPARPRDPDATSGYYQPLRVVSALLPLLSIAAVRIQCGLAAVPPEVAAEYRRRYRPNLAPPLPTLDRVIDDAPPPRGEATRRALRLTLHLPATAAEDYLRYDVPAAALSDDRERLRVSWFSGQGVLAESVTAVEDRGASGLTSSNLWWRDDEGPAWLWAVLRDNRGAVTVLPVAVPAAAPAR